jgi:adenosylhomocysteine nucleosidase
MSSLEQPPILVVAALGYELKKLNRAAHPGLALLETGEGVVNAERNLEAWLGRRRAHVVLSIGFAGALSPELRVGDLVVAKSVHGSNAEPDHKLLAAASRLQLDSTVHLGTALTSDVILWRAAEKRALASSLGANEIGFVDMESTAIASVCARRGVPFLIVRSITDLLDEDLPLDFNQCRDSEGRVNSIKVMKAALLNPGSISGLLSLRKRSELCAERMGDFVIRLTALIGPGSGS